VLHNGLETAGLVYTSSAAASVWFLRERISVQNGIGIVISFAGVLMVASSGSDGAGALQLLGNALVLGGLIAWVAFTIQGKKMKTDHDPLVSTAAGVGSALLFLVPLAIWELATTGSPEVTAEGIVSIAYLGALASALAYWLWNHALGEMDASEAAPYLNLVPAIAVVLALIFGESIAPGQLVGGAVVAFGVWLSGRSARSARRTARQQEACFEA
jgi:drug/metabolite transporter (DMT)-like permease